MLVRPYSKSQGNKHGPLFIPDYILTELGGFDLNLGNDRSVPVAIEALFMCPYRPTCATVRPFVLP